MYYSTVVYVPGDLLSSDDFVYIEILYSVHVFGLIETYLSSHTILTFDSFDFLTLKWCRECEPGSKFERLTFYKSRQERQTNEVTKCNASQWEGQITMPNTPFC